MNKTLTTAEFTKRTMRSGRRDRVLLKALKNLPPHEAHRLLAKAQRMQRWRWS